jgi:hypothetical protein
VTPVKLTGKMLLEKCCWKNEGKIVTEKMLSPTWVGKMLLEKCTLCRIALQSLMHAL